MGLVMYLIVVDVVYLMLGGEWIIVFLYYTMSDVSVYCQIIAFAIIVTIFAMIFTKMGPVTNSSIHRKESL